MPEIRKITIPQSYVKLKERLIRLSTPACGSQFSVTKQQYLQHAKSVDLDTEKAELALKLFVAW